MAAIIVACSKHVGPRGPLILIIRRGHAHTPLSSDNREKRGMHGLHGVGQEPEKRKKGHEM